MSSKPPVDRRRFLRGLVALASSMPLAGCARSTPPDASETKETPRMNPTSTPRPGRMPVLFVGHGSPMNAIEDNRWSRSFRLLARSLPRPRAILSISAHWFVPGTFLTANERPETIHDFSGFAQALFEMKYPAPGDVDLAKRVVSLLGNWHASLRTDWGLDHGTWSVLHHLYPPAYHPVVQLSIDRRLSPAEHVAIGSALTPLREQGVLIMGSGNITHNLRHAMASFRSGDRSTPSWANDFDAEVARAIEQHDWDQLARVVETDSGRMAHPTLDHYLPLLYAAGAAGEHDTVDFPITGFDGGSLSMRSVIFG
jgi:4,5-DOPA dioxygenase extradiol